MSPSRFETGPNPEKDTFSRMPVENPQGNKDLWASVADMPVNDALAWLSDAAHWHLDFDRLAVKTTDSQYNMYSGKLSSGMAADVMVTGVTTESPWSYMNKGIKPIRVLFLKGDRTEEDRKIVDAIGEHVLPRKVAYLEGADITAYTIARGARRIVRTLANSPYTEGYNERLRQRALKLAREASKATGKNVDIEQIGSYANGGDTSPDDIDFFVIPTPMEKH